jgi:hypothetical protein
VMTLVIGICANAPDERAIEAIAAMRSFFM